MTMEIMERNNWLKHFKVTRSDGKKGVAEGCSDNVYGKSIITVYFLNGEEKVYPNGMIQDKGVVVGEDLTCDEFLKIRQRIPSCYTVVNEEKILIENGECEILCKVGFRCGEENKDGSVECVYAGVPTVRYPTINVFPDGSIRGIIGDDGDDSHSV